MFGVWVDVCENVKLKMYGAKVGLHSIIMGVILLVSCIHTFVRLVWDVVWLVKHLCGLVYRYEMLVLCELFMECAYDEIPSLGFGGSYRGICMLCDVWLWLWCMMRWDDLCCDGTFYDVMWLIVLEYSQVSLWMGWRLMAWSGMMCWDEYSLWDAIES